ncbi:hypothetical protein EVAR_96531_1 [Eumeta japonica]|uniref:Uncharacterized protein n=1 Tax=Eumeta variegata TaxID=151549 RepID=A0A4C1WGE9_EUMVA|nr:hypothetical protein EVAR_96531_1 [Eumeta japonica]
MDTEGGDGTRAQASITCEIWHDTADAFSSSTITPIRSAVSLAPVGQFCKLKTTPLTSLSPPKSPQIEGGSPLRALG